MICTEAFQLIFVVVDCFVLLLKKIKKINKNNIKHITLCLLFVTTLAQDRAITRECLREYSGVTKNFDPC